MAFYKYLINRLSRNSALTLVLILWPQILSANETTYYCVETVSMSINFRDEIYDYQLGKVLIHIANNQIVTVDAPTGGQKMKLYPYNSNRVGLSARNWACEIHIQPEQPPKQLVCNYGYLTGVYIQNFKCSKF